MAGGGKFVDRNLMNVNPFKQQFEPTDAQPIRQHARMAGDPFASEAQRRFMHAKHPGIAKHFERETPKGKKLPMHVRQGRGR